MKNGIKAVLKTVLSLIFLASIVIGTYYFSYITGGELTTVQSCSSSYISAEYDLATLKKQCSSLQKESLLAYIEEAYKNEVISVSRYLDLIVEVKNEF